MKRASTLISALGISLALTEAALAQEYTKGEVTKIDPKQKKLTIRHEQLKSLEMPAMIMVFVVAEDFMLDKVEVVKPIEFVAGRVNGRITVMDVK